MTSADRFELAAAQRFHREQMSRLERIEASEARSEKAQRRSERMLHDYEDAEAAFRDE